MMLCFSQKQSMDLLMINTRGSRGDRAAHNTGPPDARPRPIVKNTGNPKLYGHFFGQSFYLAGRGRRSKLSGEHRASTKNYGGVGRINQS